jgi:uncharacterized membrane protein YdbT with pleckstrin-like domain
VKDKYLNSLLGANEQILLIARQHWLVLAGEIITEIVLSVAICVLLTLILVLWLPIPLLALGYLLLILPLVSLWRDVTMWANRKYVVTNRRVIQLSGIFSKRVTDSSLEKVNDVRMEQSFLGRLFDFGDIEILTASELGANLFTRIGKPIRFKTAMLNAKEQLERVGDGERALDVPGVIVQLEQLRRQSVLTDEEFQQKKAELLAKL